MREHAAFAESLQPVSREQMLISVVICTWNRCRLLEQTLEQMTRLTLPDGVSWELLVVNNNCSDATDEVIASFAGSLPIRRLLEPRPGKSHALNLAIRHVRGDYILWTDDDVLVDEQWLAEYCVAFNRWPEATVFGGTVVPWFEGVPPPWLAQGFSQVSAAFAVRDFGSDPLQLDIAKGYLPFGANFAVKTDAQLRHPYDAALGPRPNSSLRGEETVVIRELLRELGSTGWWVPPARVRHYIPKSRQSIAYVRSFYFGAGEAEALTAHSGSSGATRKPRWIWRRAVEAEFRYRILRAIGRPVTAWMEHLKQASFWWGVLGVRVWHSHRR